MAEKNHKSRIESETIRARILENEFGPPGQPFMRVKDFSRTFSLGMDKAQAIFCDLREEGILMLSRKKHYLSHGIIPSDSPLGRMRQERKLIALLAERLESWYTPTFADSVATYLQKEGYALMTFFVTEGSWRQALRSLYDMGVQGLLVLMEIPLIHKICRFSYVPCATSGYDCTGAGVDSVLSGGSKQAKLLADMMLEEGCKRFYFATPKRAMLEENPIYKAFVGRLCERNVNFESDIIITEAEVKKNSNVLDRRLRAKDEKIGLVCTNEQLTQRIMRYCDENKISVPNAVMVAAFRTKSAMNQERREIITVEENIVKEAEEAATILLKRIRGDTSPPKVIVVEPKVINRMKK